MGASLGTLKKKEVIEVGEETITSPWNPSTKNPNYHVPETVFDDLPEWQGDQPPIEPLKFGLNEVIAWSQKSAEESAEFAQELLKGFQQHRLIVLQMSTEQVKEYYDLLRIGQQFLSQPSADKKKEFYPTRTLQSVNPELSAKRHPEGAEPLSSGYYDVHFDNRNNKRDEEWRDVYIVYTSDLSCDYLVWPNTDLRDAMQKHTKLFWDASVAVLVLLERALGLAPQTLLEPLVHGYGQLKGGELPDLRYNKESNFAVIRYYDNVEGKKEKQPYKTPQRCMVHRDLGFVTLLPKATEPGIQAYCQQVDDEEETEIEAEAKGKGKEEEREEGKVKKSHHRGVWVEMERYTKPGDVLVYTGRMLEMLTQGQVRPLIHRVVRYPSLERMSSPFEAKANPEAVITTHPETGEVFTTSRLKVAMDWDRLQRTVLRADGLPPDQHEPHLNGSLVPLLKLYGDNVVVSE